MHFDNPTDGNGIEYKTIERFEGYCFGSDGTVWSQWKRGPSGKIGEVWRLCPGTPNKKGYLKVALKNKITYKQEFFYIQSLILEAFVGPRPDGMEARHFPDNDRSNNSISNLSWGYHIDNINDKEIHETQLYGEKNHATKLSDLEINEIRRMYSSGIFQSDIAKIFKVSQPHISTIINYKRRSIS